MKTRVSLFTLSLGMLALANHLQAAAVVYEGLNCAPGMFVAGGGTANARPLAVNAAGDADGDRLANLMEYALGTSPIK